MAKAKHPRFDKPYAQMVYQPMLEVMKYLRDNGYQNLHRDRRRAGFRARLRAAGIRHLRRNRSSGRRSILQYEYNKDGQGILMRDPKLLLNNNFSGKAEDIYLFTGRPTGRGLRQLDR